MKCPDENALVAWFERELDDDARAAIEAHVEACEDCRALLIALAAASCEVAEPEARDAAAPLTVGARLGRYVVLDWLGKGGMGAVYAAFDPELDRRVAIKVLHADIAPGDGDGASVEDAATTGTLLREAQALARVSHPSVVAVYDVGTQDGRVFLSMEYVAGGTLERWLGSEPRSWRAILACFLDAGRGLAAAHAAGLVHHDFKPSNVLVGLDGRVRVTDFGLARFAAAEGSAPSGARSWKGTPGYMSPEQRRGERVDARSDQYSFCVALRESLRGEQAEAGAPDPARGGVPAFVSAALARGLADDPAARFPTMDALLTALAHRRRSPWRLLGVALVAALIGALGVFAWARVERHATRPCAGAERKLVGVWDGDRKRAVAAAFEATGALYAKDTWREVERVGDAYAARWITMHEEACEATRVRGEQSEELLDLRIACLDGEARELGALGGSLAQPSPRAVELAVKAIHDLPSLDACADARALRARVRPSMDPAVQAEVGRVRALLAGAAALDKAGRAEAAGDAMAPLLPAAQATLDRGLEAEVGVALAQVRTRLGDVAGSDAALYAAIEAGEAASDDVVKARALVLLTLNLASQEAKPDEAARAGGLASAVLTRLPAEIALLSEAEINLSAVDDAKGRYDGALVRTEHARALRERAFGPDDYLVGHALNASSVQLTYLGETEKALDYQQRALVIFERTLGAHHPQVAIVLRNIGISELALQRYDDALAHVGRARAIWVEVHGEEHPDLPGFDGAIAEILLGAHRLPEARIQAARALALGEKLHMSEVDLIDSVNLVGAIDAKLGRFDEAVAAFTRAAAMCARLSEPVFETATTFTLLGDTYLSMGHAAQARAPLERALALREKSGMRPGDLAETQILLGHALWDGGGDRARARALVTTARAGLATRPDAEKERADVDRWLSEHASPARPVAR